MRDLRLAIKILMTRQQFFMTEEETEEVSLSRQDNTAIQRAAEIPAMAGLAAYTTQ